MTKPVESPKYQRGRRNLRVCYRCGEAITDESWVTRPARLKRVYSKFRTYHNKCWEALLL